MISIGSQQVRAFQEQGFLPVGSLTTAQELDWLRTSYDQIVASRYGASPDRITTSVAGSENSLFTVLSPEGDCPQLNETAFARNAREIFARLYGVSPASVLAGWRLFFKPPSSTATAWHQDAAYRPPPFDGASVWMPLDAATLTSGCMHYIAGSHRDGLKAHHTNDGHRETDAVDTCHECIRPANSGEGIFHHCLTVHSASPNASSKPRRAIVIVFQVDNN